MIPYYAIVTYLAGLSWLSLVLRWHVRKDVDLWLKSLPKTHGWPAIRERGFDLLPSFICLSLFHPFPWVHGAFWEALLTVPFAVFLISMIWWTCFDGFYNVARTRTKHARVFGWWDLGDPHDPTETNQSGGDQFLYGKPLWLHKTIKLGAILVALAAYLLPYFFDP